MHQKAAIAMPCVLTGSALTVASATLLLTLVCQVTGRADDAALARRMQNSLDRRSSRVMVKLIERADRATLDLAAWDRNPLFHYPLEEAPAKPASIPSLEQLTFDGALTAQSIRNSIEQTPLTEAERAHPLAWQPLVKYLAEWNYEAAAPDRYRTKPVTCTRLGDICGMLTDAEKADRRPMNLRALEAARSA